MSLSPRKKKLLNKAREMYGEIAPAGRKKTFEEGFTHSNNKLVFWFNTTDGSTHVVIENGAIGVSKKKIRSVC